LCASAARQRVIAETPKAHSLGSIGLIFPAQGRAARASAFTNRGKDYSKLQAG
jgi:hypothetical protein